MPGWPGSRVTNTWVHICGGGRIILNYSAQYVGLVGCQSSLYLCEGGMVLLLLLKLMLCFEGKWGGSAWIRPRPVDTVYQATAPTTSTNFH